MPGDIGKHSFRGLSWEASDGGADDRPEGQNAFMDGHKVNYVPGFAAVSSGRRFIGCKSAGCST
jgi:hypothetical protein